MAHISRKLSNAVEGALAGGGDPATSPLYIFGPFLRLVVVAGVAQVTFGASVWLVVFTIAMVSAMYRLVMAWVTDGSGGSGLSEEEFGGWAVKVNAGITFIEYTLTFLVSMAALVTFLADRLPILNEPFLGIQLRTIIAILLSILTGWLVNRGPKVATLAFGPATAAVLALLWVMVFTSIWRYGFILPDFNFEAFTAPYIGFTFGGFARTLAVMTGIEVFANLVAAYEGDPAEKSRKAFNSLLIIMGTTAITMLILGPTIFALSDPTNTEVSVFTQTMDQLLPAPLPLIGTIIGVAVLLSASAASAQGLQNLFTGLKYRHYVPAFMGQRNQFGVADKPVWLEITIVALCFLAFGTHEETYLAIYAAGVFILLTMTGWAAAKRLIRQLREDFQLSKFAVLLGTIIAASLTSVATVIIFSERFLEGAWTYFLFVPALYVIFTYYRQNLGEPALIQDRLGQLISNQSVLAPPQFGRWLEENRPIRRLLVPLDGSDVAEQALPLAATFANMFRVPMSLLTVTDKKSDNYLEQVVDRYDKDSFDVHARREKGGVADTIHTTAHAEEADLIVMSTHGHTGWRRMMGSVATELIPKSSKPILLVRPNIAQKMPAVQKILVTLDGSALAEQVLPYVQGVATQFGSEVFLLNVPQSAAGESSFLQMEQYLQGVQEVLENAGIPTHTLITGTDPVPTILEVSQQKSVDLIMIATSGRGGIKRLLLGSVADAVMRQAHCPVYIIPAAAN
jgi:nucleotide-binding universal stress UspA family protein